jgi:hypothetical protein
MQTTDTSPAGGAEIVEVVIATGGALLATAALLLLGWAHRTGRTDLLRRVAEAMGRGAGLAPWAALPALLAAGSLLVALLGMYWDISLHIDDGRDAGPLANPAHYLILAGLFGIFAAGFLAIVLPEERPSRGAVRIGRDWYAPLGGIAMLASAGFALLGFPLDDVWHRIFGQDVTLWGPTHLMLIGGAGMTLIGTSALVIEGRAAAPPRPESTGLAKYFDALAEQISRWRRVSVMGGLLIGMSVFQGEFDFGVPQFQLVLHPMLIAFAAGIALVAARIWLGPGGALGAALFFVVVRGGVALIVGPGFGETTPHLPLYAAEALCVELAALAIPAQRPYLVGAVSGALIGTVGFAAEYGWSHLWMPVPWPETLIGEAVLPTLVVAIAAGTIGAFMGSAFAAGALPERRRMPSVAPAALGVMAIAVAVGLNITDKPAQGVRADVTLREITPAPERTVEATVRFDPASATEDAHWVTGLAWQGGEKLAIDHLEEVGPGVYRTTEPLPVHGTWKALIRVHDENSLSAVPVYLPEDTAIPAKAVPAPPSFTRGLVDETEILQRELKDDVPGYLAGVAYAIVGGVVLAIIVLLGWVLVRLGRGAPTARGPRPGRARMGHREATA